MNDIAIKGDNLSKKHIISLREKEIGVNVHYIPVHLQPYYRKRFGYREGDFPVAESYYKKCISLPIHKGMTDEEMDYVISIVDERVNI